MSMWAGYRNSKRVNEESSFTRSGRRQLGGKEKENVESQSEGWGGDGGSTCERPQKMSPLHLEILFIKEHNECESSGWQLFSEAYTELIGPVLFLMYINNLDPWVNSDSFNLVRDVDRTTGRARCCLRWSDACRLESEPVFSGRRKRAEQEEKDFLLQLFIWLLGCKL
eukprot:bmy_19038T0